MRKNVPADILSSIFPPARIRIVLGLKGKFLSVIFQKSSRGGSP